jgi:hypothetical protein
MNLIRTREETCLTDFTLDRWLASELSEREESSARAHLSTCGRCEARHAALRRERERFAAEAAPLVLPPRRARAWHPWLASGGAALAMAAFALLLLRPHGAAEGTRTKGGSTRLEVYVSHGGDVRRGGPGEAVAPGDALRFVVTSLDLPYVAVVSLDGAKHASVYYPSRGEVAPIPLARSFALPESTVLDDTLGEERVFAMFCPRSFATEPLRRAMEAAPDRAPALEGCQAEVLVLHKEGAPSP